VKRIGQILLGILVVLVLLVGGVLGWAYYDMNTGGSEALTNTTIEGDGVTLNAYLAEPSGEGPHPAVIMIHEWWGLREGITQKADALAEQGYVVLAVDAFRGQQASSVPGALVLNLSYDQALIDADMDTYLDFLTGRDDVDASRVGIMGYCFGGRQATMAAVRQPAAFAAVLNYYGGSTPNTVEALEPLRGQDVMVLGVFGEEDTSIPLEEVDTFEASLQELDIEHEITVYEGVGHAFVTEDSINETDTAAAQAWQQGVTFLDTHLTADAESDTDTTS